MKTRAASITATLAIVIGLVAAPPAASADIASPIDLSGSITGELYEWVITPDSSRVVYRAEQDVADRIELFSVPIHGGEPVRLNTQLTAGEDVQSFALADGGRRVVYNVSGPDRADLYSVSVDGGTPTQLNIADPATSVWTFAVSADGGTVVFVPGAAGADRTALFAVPVRGGAPTQLDTPLGDAEFINALWMPPSGSRILYSTGDLTKEFPCCNGTWSTDLGGGAAVLLLDTGPGQIEFAGSTVLIEGYSEIYAVPITGGTAVRVSKPYQYNIGHVEDFAVSPDSNTVVYRWTVIENLRQVSYNLFSVPITGGPSTRIDGVPGNNWEAAQYEITPDSTTVVYLMRNNQSGTIRGNLYRVPIGGGEPVLYHDYLTGDLGVSGFDISPDGTRLAYWGDIEDDLHRDLYLTDTMGGQTFHVDHGPVDTDSALFTTDGRYVLYTTDDHYRIPAEGGTGEYLVDWAANRTVSPDAVWMVFESSSADLYSILVNPADHTCEGEVATHVGTAGDDRIVGTAGRDVIVGYDGDDVINAKAGDDLICGGDGNDTIRGHEGEDTIHGGDGRDLLYGGDQRDYLYGDAHVDVIFGEGGKDYAYGGGGDDWIDGGPQIDRLKGQSGDDTILGGYGRDIIKGGFGNDDLRGQSGDDTIYAGAGTDTCHGGTGTDTADACETTTNIP